MRHIGVSNFDVAQLRRAQAIAPVETLQPPYSLLERDVEDEILPFAQREGIGVIVYSPMASGLLSGRDDGRADRRDARRRLAQARPALPGAPALAPPGPRRAPAGGRRAPRHHRRVRSRWRGRCTTRRCTARSSASAAPTRSSALARRRRTSSSPTRTSPRSPAPEPAAGDHLRHAPAPRSARAARRRASSACAPPTSSCTRATSSPPTCWPTCARSGRPVEAVHGNVDDHEVRALLPSARMVSRRRRRGSRWSTTRGAADGRLARLRRALPPRGRRGRLRPLAHPAARARSRDGLSDLQSRQPDRPPPPADAHDGPGADRRGWRGELRADRPRVNVAERVQASDPRGQRGRARPIVAGPFTLYRNRASDHPYLELRGAERRRASSGRGSTPCARPSRRTACGRAWSSWPSARRAWRRRSRPTGFELQGRYPVMTLPAEELREVPAPDGVVIARVLAGRRRARAAADGGRGVRRRSAHRRAGRRPTAGAACWRAPAASRPAPRSTATIADGVSELGGIGVRERFRRRGIAAALTAARRGRRRGRRGRAVLPHAGRRRRRARLRARRLRPRGHDGGAHGGLRTFAARARPLR